MFDLLDDGREVRRRAMLRPRYAFIAVFWLFLLGVDVGILIGKGNRGQSDWFAVGLNGLTLLWVCAPLFREFFRFLRDHEVN